MENDEMVQTELLDVTVDEVEFNKPLINERAELSHITPFTEEEIEKKIKQIEAAFRMLRIMKESCLTNIQTPDVLDMNGEPYVLESGFSNFRLVFGIEEKNLKKTIVYKDGSSRLTTDPLSMQGEFDYVLMDGVIRSNLFGVETKVSGGVKVDEDFNADKSFWLKKAEANWKRRAISNLLGLQKVTWDNLPNVKMDKCSTVTHSKTKKGDSAKAEEVWNSLLNLNEGSVKAAEDMCTTLTTFTTKEGKTIKGKPRPHNLSDAQLNFLSGKLKDKEKQNGNKQNGNNNPVALLLQKLGELYKVDNDTFIGVLSRNGYTAESVKQETNTFKLEVLVEEIKQEINNIGTTQSTSAKI